MFILFVIIFVILFVLDVYLIYKLKLQDDEIETLYNNYSKFIEESIYHIKNVRSDESA